MPEWFDRPFIQSDLASWLAFAAGVLALVAAIIAVRRRSTHFAWGDNFIYQPSPGVFRFGVRIAVTTFAASFMVTKVECAVILGGMRLRRFGVGGERVTPAVIKNPEGSLIKGGAILEVEYELPVPEKTNRGTGMIKIRLADGTKKRYWIVFRNLQMFD